jgi:hypothetical protein
MAFPHIKPPLPERIEALTSGIAHTEARIAGLTPEQAKGPFGRALRAKLTSLRRSLKWYEGRGYAPRRAAKLDAKSAEIR